MNTLNTPLRANVCSPGARWLTALLTLCCAIGVLPSMAASWRVGTGTTMWTQNNVVPAPLNFWNGVGRGQYMYRASELTAAGIPANTPINQIAFNVGALQNSDGTLANAPNFQLGVQQTTLTALNPGSFINSGFTSASTSTGNNRAGLGWNTFTLSTPIIWDGLQNIVVDFCYNTGFNPSAGGTGYGNAGVYYHTSPTGGPFSIYYSAANGTTVACGSSAISTTTSTLRPNIRFSSNLPCTGVPASAVGVLNYPATNSGICPGTSITLQDTNYATNVGMTFQWETATNSAGPWTNIGGNHDRLHTPPLTSSVYYRLNMTCNFGGSGTTPAVYFPVATPVTYATIPFSESFESWSNGCGTSDKPGAMWTNIPSTGNNSRRRDDQGASASWSPTPPAPVVAKDGTYSSRFYGYGNSNTSQLTNLNPGNEFSLHLDCSGPGNKEIRFWYMFKYQIALGTLDSLIVELSTNGGYTFSPITGGQLNNFFGTPQQWSYLALPIVSVSPNTIVRFRSRALTPTQTNNDLYLDKIDVVPACNGKPVAGRIDSATACVNNNVTLYTSGTSMAAGLTYQWQTRPNGSTLPWAPMPAGTGPSVTTTVTTAPQDIRVIVGCSNTTPNPLYDTSAVYTLRPAPFYYCYCAANATYTAQYGPYVLVGNTTIMKTNGDTLMSNGNALPYTANAATGQAGYEDFRMTVPAPSLVLDSAYRLNLWVTSNYYSGLFPANALGWIDFDRNGTFDPTTERIISRQTGNSSNPVANQVFTVPATASVGLTGMRVLLSNGSGFAPCGNATTYGQFEDYLVRIEYQPCDGPASAGQTFQSDTSVCPGYTVNLWNTTYQQDRTGIARMWELSTNNGASYQAIAGSADKDSMINLIVTPATSSMYRLRLICTHSNDTTYSNAVTVRTPVPYRCYPTNWASYGPQDSSDIGTVIIGDRVFPSSAPGPHLQNPNATQRRTDWTLEPPIELHADSTYRLGVFHTMPRAWHSDALVSVFFDYNNDGDYDVTVPGPPFVSELAMQGVSVYDSFFLDARIKIPSAVIPNVPTGMRVVLNNNLNPAASGNNGIGAFTSGEVEDFVVIFRRVNVGVDGSTLLNNVGIYPNPTDGRFNLVNDATSAVNHMDVVVTTVSGQEVIRRSFDNVGTHFRTSLDLSTQAKGIYFVEIRADGEKVTKKLVVR